MDGLIAGGWTPIGPALKEAAAQLGGQPGRVVLITDGKNTCQAVLLCEVAKELKTSNPGLSISVLGLRTDQEEMGCVAQTTGGVYTTADTAMQLLSRGVAALDEARAASSLTPSGVAGIQVGRPGKISPPHIQISRLFEGSARQEWNGETMFFVVWLSCRWLFCRCRPTENAGELVLSFESLGPYHLGATDLVEKGRELWSTPTCAKTAAYKNPLLSCLTRKSS